MGTGYWLLVRGDTGQRLTVTLLLPTAREIAIIPARSAGNNSIRDRQTTFCGVFRPETHPSRVARSAGGSQIHACASCIPIDSHVRPDSGIVR